MLRKSKIIKNQKEQINRMIDDICDLENRIEVLQEKNDKLVKALDCHIEDLFNEYDYVILTKDKHKTTFWNKGRFEENVKELYFNQLAGDLPKIIMEK